MMRAMMMVAMIRATYYAIIQFYFVVYAHNASFILEFYSQPIVPAIPAAYCINTSDGQTMDRWPDYGLSITQMSLKKKLKNMPKTDVIERKI
jgi:hypothetical protein